MNITLIGSGVYSLAFAYLLGKEDKNKIHIWTHDTSWKEKIEKNKEYVVGNKKIPLKENIHIYTDLKESLANTNMIFIMVSSDYVKDVIDAMSQIQKYKVPILIGSKGLIEVQPYFPCAYVKKCLKTSLIGFFEGPTLAEDLVNDAPVCMTVASHRKKVLKDFHKIIPDTIYLEQTNELEVIEVASVLKNIYAIGAGIVSSLYDNNSTLLSYAGKAYQEYNQILFNEFDYENDKILAGMTGDFFFTCTLNKSRNYTYGRKIAKNQRLAVSYMTKNTVEGYYSLENVMNLLGKHQKKYPILNHIYQIVYYNKKSNHFIDFLK